MARPSDIDMRDVDMLPKCIPVDVAKQILPGAFEHALQVFIDDERDLAPFSADLRVDLTGATTYHLSDRRPMDHKPILYGPRDCQVGSDFSHCVCPAGQRLYRNGAKCRIGGQRAVPFTGAKSACGKCAKRAQCLRKSNPLPVLQAAMFVGRSGTAEPTATDRMERLSDSTPGQ